MRRENVSIRWNLQLSGLPGNLVLGMKETDVKDRMQLAGSITKLFAQVETQEL